MQEAVIQAQFTGIIRLSYPNALGCAVFAIKIQQYTMRLALQ